MAHRPTQRRNSSAAPLYSNPPPPSSTVPPTPSNHPKPPTTPFHRPKPHPDLITQTSKPNPFPVKQFSSLNLGQNHKHHPKSMAASAILDSSPNFSLHKTHDNNGTKQSNSNSTKRISSKEKPLIRKNKGYLVEDFVEIEKSRNHRQIVEEEEEERDNVDFGKRRNSSVSVVAQSGGGGGGRRRSSSLCGSQIELRDVFAINGVKMVSADMPPFMQIHAVDCARKALDSMEKFTSKTLALSLKKEFDGVYGPAWHCIVGNSFGSYVTHSVGGFFYFSMDQKLYVLLFKTAVQKVT